MHADFVPPEQAAEILRLTDIFARQRAAHAQAPFTNLALRRDRLQRLRSTLLQHRASLIEAISADFGHRASQETELLELIPSIAGIKHALSHLARWMRPQKRAVSVWFMPASNRLIAQPLGVIGVIVPWNYPLFMATGPLISALAAGNRAVIKMSEFTPRTGAALKQALLAVFSEDEVAVINGPLEVAQAFGKLPFDHLLFTGSTAVGKQVMRAASENLTPVTLELGGKSPTIIHPDFPIKTAAQRILHGKCLNAGQTCVAPDYVLLPEGQEAAFIKAASSFVQYAYPDAANNPDYSNIINARHLARLQGYLQDVLDKGGRVQPLCEMPEDSPKLAPTLVFGLTDEMQLSQEEVFGPILPVITYRTLEQAIAYVNARPRPLALYYFDYDNERIGQVLSQTISGGVGINETVMQAGQDDLPFGGVGPSGMGHYHGYEGFQTFSKMKPVFIQGRYNALRMIRPPYGRKIAHLINLMLR